MGKYLLDRYRPTIQERLVDVSKMVISKALIAKPQGPQPLQAHANVDWTKNSAELRFLTLDVSLDCSQYTSFLTKRNRATACQQSSMLATPSNLPTGRKSRHWLRNRIQSDLA